MIFLHFKHFFNLIPHYGGLFGSPKTCHAVILELLFQELTVSHLLMYLKSQHMFVAAMQIYKVTFIFMYWAISYV